MSQLLVNLEGLRLKKRHLATSADLLLADVVAFPGVCLQPAFDRELRAAVLAPELPPPFPDSVNFLGMSGHQTLLGKDGFTIGARKLALGPFLPAAGGLL